MNRTEPIVRTSGLGRETGDAAAVVPRRNAERGQTLTLFLLIFVTLTLIGIIATTMGQTLVRRQHAQMVVDAAAFAGASRQAQGMNDIAALNNTAQNDMLLIQIQALEPHIDNSDTSWIIFGLSFTAVGPAIYRLANDWERDALKSYKSVFEIINSAIDAVNVGYRFWPMKDAGDVVDANFGSGKLFPGEQPLHKGQVLLADGSPLDKLVKLTDPKDYHVRSFGTYQPNPSVLSDLLDIPYVGWILAGDLEAATEESWLAAEIRMLADPIAYKMGRFYDNSSGDDVRFTYYLTIKSTPVALGHNFFSDIPPITVVASAKPYDGYLGDDYNDTFFTTEGDNEIREEYKARMVRVKRAAVLEVPIRIGESPFNTRWITVTH